MTPLLDVEGELIRTPAFPLAMVSRQVCSEFMSLFHNTHEFNFIWLLCYSRRSSKRFAEWIKAMANNVRHLRKLRIHVHACGGCCKSFHRPVCSFRPGRLLPLVNFTHQAPKCIVKFEEWLLYREDEGVACHNLEENGEPSFGFEEVLQRINNLLYSWKEAERAETNMFLADPTLTTMTFTRLDWKKMCEHMNYKTYPAIAYEDGRLIGLPWDTAEKHDDDPASQKDGL